LSNSLWDAKTTAEYLGISVYTVYRYVENNQLPHIKKPFGLRFRKADLDNWLEQDKRKSTFVDNILKNALTNSSPLVIDKTKGGVMARSSKSRRFAYGSVYQRRSGGSWTIDYRDAQGKRNQKVVKRATCWEDAHEALRNAIFREFYEENGIREKESRIKFKDFADMYLRNYSMVKKRAWKSTDRIYLNANLIPYFGEHEITKITPLLVERFITKRVNDGVKKSTINRDLSCLKKMFNKAIDWNYLSENPLKKVKMFSEKDNVRDRVLSEEEEARLLKKSPEHLRLIIVVALNTGMRLGEILNLQWNQVDFRNRRIRVEKTKSGGIRFTPINDVLLEELQILRSRDGQIPYLFANPKTGKPLTTIKTAFNAVCRRSSIKGLWFHDLRRSFAQRLFENGVDIITVQNLLGHHSVVVTERYLQTNEKIKREAVEMLIQVKNCDSLVTNW